MAQQPQFIVCSFKISVGVIQVNSKYKLSYPVVKKLSVTVGNLGAGESFNLAENGQQQTVTFTSPGTQRISVHADFNNATKRK